MNDKISPSEKLLATAIILQGLIIANQNKGLSTSVEEAVIAVNLIIEAL